MARYVQLPPQSTGVRVDVRELLEDGVLVHRERVEIATSVPRMSSASVAAVAAGGMAVLDSAAVTAGRRSRLMRVLVTGTAAFKAEIQSVQEGLADTHATRIEVLRAWDFVPPTPDFITVRQVGGPGFTGFRVVITNLSPAETVDFYASFFTDEEEPAP